MAFTLLTNDFHEATALLLQQKESFAMKMYIEYSDANDYTTPTDEEVEATSDHNAYYTDIDGVTEDFLRIDVVQFSRVTDSGYYQGERDLPYSNNKVTFTGFTSDGGATGENSLAIADKYIYGAAIVMSDTSVNTVVNDVILARAYFDTAYTQVTSTKGASVQIALNLVNDGSCYEFAEGNIAFTGLPGDAETFTIVNNASSPVSTVFEFDTATDDYDGETLVGANVSVGISSATTAAHVSLRVTTAINGADIDVTATDGGTAVGTSDIAVDHCGVKDVTTSISTSTGITNGTVTNFTGGA
jgi:hypothetical protein